MDAEAEELACPMLEVLADTAAVAEATTTTQSATTTSFIPTSGRQSATRVSTAPRTAAASITGGGRPTVHPFANNVAVGTSTRSFGTRPHSSTNPSASNSRGIRAGSHYSTAAKFSNNSSSASSASASASASANHTTQSHRTGGNGSSFPPTLPLAGFTTGRSNDYNLLVVDGSASPHHAQPPRIVLQPIQQPAARASSTTNQITPPKPRAKAPKISINLSGVKHHIPGFVVGLPIPTMFGNYPSGIFRNIRKIIVNHSTVPIEMNNPRSELWHANELLKKVFQHPNGFWATTGQRRFKALSRQIPFCLILQALELEDNAQALHDLAAIGNYCSAVGKEGMDILNDDCKDRYLKPTKSCEWKELLSSAKGAAIAANQGTSSNAISRFDGEKRKEEFIARSQSEATVQVSKRYRRDGDPAVTHRQFWDRLSKSAARSLQNKTKTLLERTDQSQVRVSYGGFSNIMTVIHNKIPKVSKFGGNSVHGAFDESIHILARNREDVEDLIKQLTSITFEEDSAKHNTNQHCEVSTWYADKKHPLPHEVEAEERRKNPTNKKQRTESLGSESDSSTAGGSISIPSFCSGTQIDDMDDDDDGMWH